jgi:hypothetical protein
MVYTKTKWKETQSCILKTEGDCARFLFLYLSTLSKDLTASYVTTLIVLLQLHLYSSHSSITFFEFKLTSISSRITISL